VKIIIVHLGGAFFKIVWIVCGKWTVTMKIRNEKKGFDS
jgi:hypothetical protein